MKKQILIIEDNQTLNKLMSKELGEKYKIIGVYNWEQAQDYLNKHEPDLIISDVKLHSISVIDHIDFLIDIAPTVLLTAYANVKDAVDAIKAGAAEYLVKPVSPEKLDLTIEKTLKTDELQLDNQFFRQTLENEFNTDAMIGSATPIKKIKELILAVAPSDTSVLITGESGTGKELVARYIHENSLRANRNFITVDCCTIQEQLFESELFGHEKGSFTGADQQKKGLIEGAKGGTLFLDEIGEIDLTMQTKLLRVLETGTFRRLGGNKILNSDVRILVATNRNLLEMCDAGEFRQDLYYRLNVFSIIAPPLRDRRQDIEELANYFLKNHKFSQRINKELAADAVRKLVAYDWPGNVRELKNVIERAIILSQNLKKIKGHHLAFDVNKNQTNSTNISFTENPSLDELTHKYLEMLLVKFSGRRSKIASILGVSERSVYRMIKRYKLT